MAYTTHGHHIAGTDALHPSERPSPARCGGPGLCKTCSVDAAPYLAVPTEGVKSDTAEKAPGNPSSPIMRYFEYKHLPEHLQRISKPFSDLAVRMDWILPPGPEKTTALRKILEGKDAAVRAALDLPDPKKGT